MKLTVSHWYLDCIAPNGDFFVGTATSIRQSKFHLNVVSESYGEDGRVVNRHSIAFAESAPRLTDSGPTWDCSPLKIRGQWISTVAPIEKTLLSTAREKIIYKGVAPRAEARVGIDNDFRVEGLGYAHQLLITSDGWTLPVNEARVGRYLTQQESLIRLDLTGNHAGTWVWRNGKEQELASVTDDLVALDHNVTLGLTYKKPVREGHLTDTLLTSLPVLKYLIPGRFATCGESLWRTRAVLLNGLEETDTGWAMHSLIQSPH
ncbi:MAG: hypothetical protein HY851_09525 [candidate division Zixibacteria bacterium]|nr:hypothetical protein [candidate division Zixibacteria bacterium]